MTDYREKARAFKEDWNPKTDDSTVAMLAAFGKEVAEKTVRTYDAERIRLQAQINATHQWLSDKNFKSLEEVEAKLAAVKKYLERHDSLYLFEEALAARPPLTADAKGEKKAG